MDNDHINGFLSLIGDEDFNRDYLSEMWFNYGEKIEKRIFARLISDYLLQIILVLLLVNKEKSFMSI